MTLYESLLSKVGEHSLVTSMQCACGADKGVHGSDWFKDHLASVLTQAVQGWLRSAPTALLLEVLGERVEVMVHEWTTATSEVVRITEPRGQE